MDKIIKKYQRLFKKISLFENGGRIYLFFFENYFFKEIKIFWYVYIYLNVLFY